MRLYWIWFAHHPELNDGERARLMEHFRDPEEIFFAQGREDIPEELEGPVRKALSNRDLTQAEKVLERCPREEIGILTFGQEAYPRRLRNIPDPPMVLYYKGTLFPMDALPVIGIVGTRHPSAYGLNMAQKMGFQIARCGAAVVSGMAMGIDAMAMRGALTGDGQVIGVLGCGVEQVYPKSNRALFGDVERFGCILSEFMPGTPPHKWNFPRRNRIISGLSCGVLVVEAPERSGSLITARLAAEQGRDVFVVPGNVDVPGFSGSYQLMREGAAPVSCGWDLVGEYAHRFPDRIRKDLAEMPAGAPFSQGEGPGVKVAQTPCAPAPVPASSGQSDKKDIDKEPSGLYSDVNREKPKLSTDEQQIADALKDGPRLVDDVIAETGLTTGRMLAAMTMLELKGILRRLPGKRIVLN